MAAPKWPLGGWDKPGGGGQSNTGHSGGSTLPTEIGVNTIERSRARISLGERKCDSFPSCLCGMPEEVCREV